MAKQKSKAVVRWIGAFGDPSLRPHSTKALEKSVRFELERTGEASFAIQEPGTRVGRAQVGLLVDLEKSRIGKIYAGDAWTIRLDCGRLIATRSNTVPPDARRVRDDTFRAYDEGFGNLVYSGIVVHRHAKKKARNSARLVAERVGLPYLGTLR